MPAEFYPKNIENFLFTAQADPTKGGAEPEGDPTKAPLTGDPTKAEPEARELLDKYNLKIDERLNSVKELKL